MRVHGQIVKLFRDRHFGFLRSAGDTRDRFFHAGALMMRGGEATAFSSLVEGMRVAYEPLDTPAGPRAVNVEILGADTNTAD